MKSVSALILALVLCSCAKVTVSADGGGEVVKPVRQLTAKEKIGLLRKEAAKRGLHWKIFCTSAYADEPESYQGVAAWTELSLSAQYEDEGRTDEWMEGKERDPRSAHASRQQMGTAVQSEQPQDEAMQRANNIFGPS